MKRTRMLLCVVCQLGMVGPWNHWSSAAEKAEPARLLSAGAAKLSVTPPLGISLSGQMHDRKARNVHDELHARSLVLDDGKTTVAMVVCDLLVVDGATVARAKQLIRQRCGIPPENVLIAATHTHTGPAIVPVFQSDPDQAYLDWLAARIADSVQCAANNVRPARVGWARGREQRAVFNRRYFLKPGTMPEDPWGNTSDTVKMNPGQSNPNVVKPAGPVDPDLPVLAIKDAEGDGIAVLSNYTLHYVGGERSGDLSADYFGMWAQIIEREWGGPPKTTKPPCVAILTNGCSGNINNVDVSRRSPPTEPYRQMENVARLVADEALRVLREIEYRDWAPLAAQLTSLDLAIRKPSASDVEAARGIVEKAGPELKSLREIYARETVLLAKRPDRVKAPIQALRIGDVGIATFPGEAFVELGLEVKSKSPFPMTFCVELANDYLGYLPTPQAFEQGGYETWRARSSCVGRDAAPAMVAAALDLLRAIR